VLAIKRSNLIRRAQGVVLPVQRFDSQVRGVELLPSVHIHQHHREDDAVAEGLEQEWDLLQVRDLPLPEEEHHLECHFVGDKEGAEEGEAEEEGVGGVSWELEVADQEEQDESQGHEVGHHEAGEVDDVVSGCLFLDESPAAALAGGVVDVGSDQDDEGHCDGGDVGQDDVLADVLVGVHELARSHLLPVQQPGHEDQPIIYLPQLLQVASRKNVVPMRLIRQTTLGMLEK